MEMILVNNNNWPMLMGAVLEHGNTISGGVLPARATGKAATRQEQSAGLVRVTHADPSPLGGRLWDYYSPASFGLRWVSIDQWAKETGATEDELAELEHLLGLSPYRLRTL